MKILTAKSAGFCFGVRKAVAKVYEVVKECTGPVYTYGPIIHNEEVVKDLEEKGVRVLYTEEDLDQIDCGTVIIRSHGVSEKIQKHILERGLVLVDATCPNVKKIHHTVQEESAKGSDILIIGNASHPEVEGIRGWCSTNSFCVETEEEALDFRYSGDRKLCVVSQTTFNYRKFHKLVEIISNRMYNIYIVKTICNATEKRQTEARQIAGQVDTMIVIGGRHSSNTQKLYEICKSECEHTYFIQTLADLDATSLPSMSCVGITAGASTPNNIIEEVQTAMAEQSFEQMLEGSLKTIHNGEVVEGTVIDVKDDEIILNIGCKADGIISKSEYSNDSSVVLKDLVKVGDTMEAKVLKVNDGEGQVQLTYKRLAAEKGNKKLEEAFQNKTVLTATVTQVMNGGLKVNVDETGVFIPASLVSDSYEKNLGKYAGQDIDFVVTEFNPRGRRIIGDRKQLLVAQKAELQKALFERIAIGDIVDGIVKNVTDFGAFVDLGGADGLLHISEMSWGRVENPKKVFKNGDEVTVLIKDISGDKIALSLKFEDQNPWLSAADKYAVGNIVEGKVARMTDFGAFVELEPGVDALLHVSQISRDHVDKPSDVLSVGQVITAKVVDFNEEDRKISLSMKALEEPSSEMMDSEVTD